MILLHIARINNNLANGVTQVVPQYMDHQFGNATIALLNCGSTTLLENKPYKVFNFTDYMNGDITQLEYPFNKPDLVIFHEIYHPYFLKVCKYLTRNNIKYIIVPHGGLTKDAQNKKRLKKVVANNTVFRYYLKNSTAIQYLSKNEDENSKVINTKFKIISGNGMHISEREKVSGYENKDFLITFIGRLDIFHKGLDLLVEGCSLIKKDIIDKNIIIKIYGPDRDDGKRILSEKIKKSGLDRNIYINEAVFGEDKEKILNNTDIIILPSRFEGQPLVGIEAICKGIPLIATKGSNLTEEITKYNCGWTCETSSREISETILKAYNDRKKIDQLAKNCIVCAQNHFDWTKITRNLMNEYNNILKMEM